MKKVIISSRAPEAIGPYSQAIEHNKMLFVSGQLPVKKESSFIPEDVADQTKWVLENIGYILKNAGYNFSDIVKTTCFLSDMKDFKAMNDVYSEYFVKDPPARATIAVKSLPLNVLIEIDCVAMK